MAINRNPTAVWMVRRRGKRGTSYQLRWIDPRTGQQRAEACGRDSVYAKTRRAQLKEEIREGLAGRLPELSLTDLAGAKGQPGKLDAMMAGRSVATVSKTKDTLRLFKALCDIDSVAAIDRRAVMDFKAKRLAGGVRPATVNKDLRQLRAVLSYAMDAGYLRTNPLLRWRGLMLKEPEKQVRVVEADEFAKLLKASENPAYRALLVVGYYQGLRRTELVNLRWSAVDLVNLVLHVVNVADAGEFTKSRKNRSLPMDPAVVSVLSQLWKDTPKRVEGGTATPVSPHVFTWPTGEPFKSDWATREFERVVKLAGVAKCSLHDLRRSFSTIAQRAGVDRSVVKDLGGWSTVAVVEKHYTGNVSPAYRAAMERIAASRTA
ncbi:MAG: Tyrosine recombinase XerC [Phycisphaerae bacterium]|nr:Tyrosine recombinase XerC [Phycisphaerae bacterium]